MRRGVAAAALLASTLGASEARAEVGFGFATGLRSIEFGLMLNNAQFQEARGFEAATNAYFTPGKLPVGLGLDLSHQTFELNKSRQFFDRFSETEVSFDLVFVPQGAKSRPALRLGYTFYGVGDAETSGPAAANLGGVAVSQQGQSSWAFAVSGFHWSVGSQVEVAKNALLSLSLDFGDTQAKITSAQLDGVESKSQLNAEGLSHFRCKSSAVLMGGEVAL